MKQQRDWLKEFPGDGTLLAVFRTTEECDQLWKKHCHMNGAHARSSGSRAKGAESPICGSSITLTDMDETVIISQRGMHGPLEVRIYDRAGKVIESRYLSHQVKAIIEKYGFPFVKAKL